MAHRKWLAALLAAVLLLTSGCWEYRKLSAIALALGMAIDQAEDGDLLLTLQFPLPGLMKQGGGGAGGDRQGGGAGQRQYYLVQGHGRSFAEALADTQKIMSRPISFGHMGVVLLSAPLLKAGAQDLMEQLWRFPELDNLSYMMVVHGGTAAGAMGTVPPQEKLPARYLVTVMETTAQSRTLARPTTLLHALVLDQERGRDYIATAVSAEGENLKIDRLAVFRRTRLAAILSMEESRALLFARGESRNVPLTIQAGDKLWVYRRLRTGRPRYSVTERPGGGVTLGVAVTVTGEAAGASGAGPRLTEAEFRQMERVLEEHLTDAIQATLAHLQEMDLDPVGFFVRRQPLIANDESWRKLYRTAQFRVSVTVRLQRKGVLD